MKLAHIAAVALTLVFLHQSYVSIFKYLDKNVGKSLYTSNEEIFMLPSVTICPISRIILNESTSYEYRYKNQLLKLEDYFLALAIDDERNFNRPLRAKEAKKMGLIEEFLSPLFPNGNFDWLPMNCFVLRALSSKATSNVTNLSATIKLAAIHPMIQQYVVWMHPEKEFFPIKMVLFEETQLIVSLTGLSQEQTLSKVGIYKVATKLLHRMNAGTTVCYEGVTKPQVEPCLKNYINSQIGCDVYGNETVCSEERHIQGYKKLSKALDEMTESQIVDVTKCAIRCETHGYEYAVVTDTETKPSNGKPDIKLNFISASFKNKVEKDVLLYDFSNLVADIGGLMGLLLGASILGLINDGEKFCRNFMSK